MAGEMTRDLGEMMEGLTTSFRMLNETLQLSQVVMELEAAVSQSTGPITPESATKTLYGVYLARHALQVQDTRNTTRSTFSNTASTTSEAELNIQQNLPTIETLLVDKAARNIAELGSNTERLVDDLVTCGMEREGATQLVTEFTTGGAWDGTAVNNQNWNVGSTA
jgi:hypothetical protein